MNKESYNFMDVPKIYDYLAVKEMGYRFTEIGQALNIHPVNIARSLEKGEKVFDHYREKWAKRN